MQKTPPNFSGRWFTTFGAMDLEQTGNQVQGEYRYNGNVCTIDGIVKKDALYVYYHEPSEQGEARFELQGTGRFTGVFQPEGSINQGTWTGERGFQGIWDTSYGQMRLLHDGDQITGFYSGQGGSTIQGELNGSRVAFRYQEPQAGGEGEFVLADDMLSFRGEWKPDGDSRSRQWSGTRVLPTPNLQWLMVLEAHWQTHLAEPEYSFGSMLREFFARLSNVRVAHRFFDDQRGLERWCQQLLYIPEPVVLVIATHGNDDGLVAQEGAIQPETIAETLSMADNISLLHFSVCLMMKNGPPSEFARVLRKKVAFPMSGYTTSVDWAASAMIEFMFLDMILSKGLSPEDAAEQVTELVAFAGKSAPEDSPYPAADFRYWPPGKTKPSAGK